MIGCRMRMIGCRIDCMSSMHGVGEGKCRGLEWLDGNDGNYPGVFGSTLI